jgi:DNA-binding XRE family transcriptional regulator
VLMDVAIVVYMVRDEFRLCAFTSPYVRSIERFSCAKIAVRNHVGSRTKRLRIPPLSARVLAPEARYMLALFARRLIIKKMSGPVHTCTVLSRTINDSFSFHQTVDCGFIENIKASGKHYETTEFDMSEKPYFLERSLTIKDVARKAGVSVATVSNVMNDKGNFSLETKRKIKAVIATVKWEPNVHARHLAKLRDSG